MFTQELLAALILVVQLIAPGVPSVSVDVLSGGVVTDSVVVSSERGIVTISSPKAGKMVEIERSARYGHVFTVFPAGEAPYVLNLSDAMQHMPVTGVHSSVEFGLGDLQKPVLNPGTGNSADAAPKAASSAGADRSGATFTVVRKEGVLYLSGGSDGTILVFHAAQ